MNKEKAKELILYISAKMDREQNYGAISLNKILYFADNIHYLYHGHSITGFDYVRQELGPTPNPKQFLPIVETLVFIGDVEQVERKAMGGYYTQKRLQATRQADTSVFSESEIKVIDSVIEVAKGHTATELSDLTHDLVGWKVAGHMEVIPYSVFCFRPKHTPPSKEVIDWAMNVVSEYKKSNDVRP